MPSGRETIFQFRSLKSVASAPVTAPLWNRHAEMCIRDRFYTSADQLDTYLKYYYSSYLVAPYSGEMYDTQSYSDGMARSDGNNDIMLAGLNGNTTLFALSLIHILYFLIG